MSVIKKIILPLLPLLVSVGAMAQFTDDFTDGDFTHNPVWSGTVDKFTVADGVLRLSDGAASGSGSFKAYLSTPSVASVAASWECKVEANVNLTSTNYVRFYLMADRDDLTDISLKGYFILIGGQQKEVAMYRQNGKNITKIIDGTDSRLTGTANLVQVKATRNEQWGWQLWSKLPTETDFVLEGEVVDGTIANAAYSGVFVNYSSKAKDKYSFDDFVVKGKPYVVEQQNIRRHSVVVSEIMANPKPIDSSMPNAEYIELYNRTDKKINLAGWQVFCGRGKATIEAGEIAPNGYIVLCGAAHKAAFEQFGEVAQMKSLPSLTNKRGLITVKDADGKTVTWTEYSDSWYGNDISRKNGGFSLERIDCDNLHNSSANWTPSHDDKGGTPCTANSMKAANADNVQPELSAVGLVGSSSCVLIFNKEMNDSAAVRVSNYLSSDVAIASAEVVEPKADRVVLTFSPALSADTVEISASNLKCVSGFALDGATFRLARHQEPQVGDLVINEILYNTDEGVGEYVEVFNKSNKVINLANICITSRLGSGQLKAPRAVTADSILLFPYKYLLISNDIRSVCSVYSCGEADGVRCDTVLPTLPNKEGNVVLCTANTYVLDELNYADDMQSPSVVNSRGVALERISPMLPTDDTSNWASASFAENYGTPARRNSQYSATTSTADKHYWLDYETFTPDGDGYRDLLTVNYKLPESGYSISATIYTPTGLRVKTLANNLPAGTSGMLLWDGRNDTDALCEVGIYVVRIEAVCRGKRINAQLVCVLGMR